MIPSEGVDSSATNADNLSLNGVEQQQIRRGVVVVSLASLIKQTEGFFSKQKQPLRADRQQGLSHTRNEVALVKSRQIHDTLGEKSLV